MADPGQKFNELVAIMRRLRGPGGCPWDREQSLDTLKKYLLEESYEVMDAIDARDWENLVEELGDLLLQPVFLATIAEEENKFAIGDALDAINEKLIRRHPHIFEGAVAHTADDVKQRWDEIKRTEKAAKADHIQSILDAVPRSLPALAEAEKVSTKAAGFGFEWPHIDGVLAKLEEESRELAAAAVSQSAESIEHEIGDLLFTVVNLARFLRVDPEQALRKGNARFRRRFRYVEENTPEGPKTLDRMEELWQEAKRHEPEYN